MSHIKHKKRILATIADLRARKSRPDADRICKYMLKTHRVSPRDTRADLQRCIQADVLQKVEYKDNVSYRATEELRERKDAERGKLMSNTGSERRLITSAVAELICQDEGCLQKGVPFNELAKAAASKSSKLSRKHLEAVIHREIGAGTLVRLPGGNLALGPADHDNDSTDSIKYEYNADSNTKMTSSHSSGGSSPLRVRGRPRKRGPNEPGKSSSATRSAAVRVGVRRKMAKKVFDPSDNNVPSKRKRGRPTGSVNKSTANSATKLKAASVDGSKRDNNSTPRSGSRDSRESLEVEERDDVSNVSEEAGGVCSVCLVQKSRGSDRLVECRDCSNKAHTSCLQSGAGMLKLSPDNTWQCPHCKTCLICCETNDAGVLTVCSVCSDAYHALCHSPRIPERLKAWDQWECSNCQKISIPVDRPSPIQHHKSPQPEPFLKPHEQEMAKSKMGDVPIDPSIPDISDWNSDDVYKYFLEQLPEVAHVFKEQDMDGQALSIARRTDIVRGLGLQLGPAMRLYRIVVKLQSRRDDFTMCWG